MRHLNQINTTNETVDNSSTDIKLDINDLKVELPYLALLSDCETLIKNEFISDEELDFEFNTESESFESPKKQGELRKNKRKALTPQRAVQNEQNQKGTTENNLVILPDVTENPNCTTDNNLFSQIYLENDLIFSDSELQDNEDLLRDIDEENIFKGIREEAGIENVKLTN